MPIYSQMETRAMQRGIQQEALRSGRKSVLTALEVRFEEVPEAIANTINSIDDVTFLESLLRQAIVIGSMAEFEQLLTPQQK